MSLAPNALLPLFSGSKRSNLSREQARYQGVKGNAVAGNSFPEALRPSFEATMSGDPAPGSRASAPLARETVSALRPAAALPCPAGPSSWRHLHETSRTRKGGCGERHTRLVSAPATPLTRPSQSLRPRRQPRRERQAEVPAPPPPQASRTPASSESGACLSRAAPAVARSPYLSSPPSASLSSAVRLGDASSLSPLAFPAAIFFSSSPKAAAAAAAVASDTPQDFMETQRIHNSNADTPLPGPEPARTPPISARDRHTNFISASSSAARGGGEKNPNTVEVKAAAAEACGATGSGATTARLQGHIAGVGRGQPQAGTAGMAGARKERELWWDS